MPKRPLGVLSLGVLIVILAISAFLFAPDLSDVLSFTLALFGLWVVVLAGMRASHLETEGRGAFTTLSLGVLITAIGVVWFLYPRAPPDLVGYLLPTLLLLLGVLVVATGLRAWRK